MQHLRPLFQPSQLPNELHPITDSFHRAFDAETRGMFMSEYFEQGGEEVDLPGEQSLSNDVFRLLHDWYQWISGTTLP